MNHKVGGETALNEGEASYTEAFHQKRQKSIVVCISISIVLVYILLLLSRNKFRELRMRGKLILNV